VFACTALSEGERDVCEAVLRMGGFHLGADLVPAKGCRNVLVTASEADGSSSKTLHVRIPFRSLPAFRKTAEKVVDFLEGKFNWPVIVVANRTIISKWGKHSHHIKTQFMINIENSCSIIT
jgi:hypothetical protein